MNEICPKCRCYSMEFDPHQGRERCLNWNCGYINRSGEPIPEQKARSYKFSEVMAKRVTDSV